MTRTWAGFASICGTYLPRLCLGRARSFPSEYRVWQSRDDSNDTWVMTFEPRAQNARYVKTTKTVYGARTLFPRTLRERQTEGRIVVGT